MPRCCKHQSARLGKFVRPSQFAFSLSLWDSFGCIAAFFFLLPFHKHRHEMGTLLDGACGFRSEPPIYARIRYDFILFGVYMSKPHTLVLHFECMSRPGRWHRHLDLILKKGEMLAVPPSSVWIGSHRRRMALVLHLLGTCCLMAMIRSELFSLEHG